MPWLIAALIVLLSPDLSDGKIRTARLRFGDADSTVELSAVYQPKRLYLDLQEFISLFTVTVISDTADGMTVLCSETNTVPVFRMDDEEYLKEEGREFVQADLLARVIGCQASVRKRSRVNLACAVEPRQPQAVGPNIGDPAPGFLLDHGEMDDVALSDLCIGGPTVLLFFRSAEWDPVSQRILKLMEANFDSLGACVVGIHGYRNELSLEWEKNLKISFPLLADETSAVMRAFGVFYRGNHPYPVAVIIDYDGIIRDKINYVDSQGEAEITGIIDAVRKILENR